MAASTQGLAVREQSTLDTVRDALGTLVARYRADEVLTSVKHIPAREAQFRPMPGWVRPELASPDAVAAQVARCPTGALKFERPPRQGGAR